MQKPLYPIMVDELRRAAKGILTTAAQIDAIQTQLRSYPGKPIHPDLLFEHLNTWRVRLNQEYNRINDALPPF